MTNTVRLKRSNVANAVPVPGDLVSGELAINYTDGNLFYKDNSGNVQVIASTQFVSVSGNVSGGNVITSGIISATGNITGNYFIGNGSQLTGVVATGIGTLANLSVTGLITQGSLANNVVTTNNIQAAAVTSVQIALDAVSGDQIKATTINGTVYSNVTLGFSSQTVTAASATFGAPIQVGFFASKLTNRWVWDWNTNAQGNHNKYRYWSQTPTTANTYVVDSAAGTVGFVQVPDAS